MSSRARGASPLVLSAPSGTGKTSIARRLVSESDGFSFSVSATTRPARGHERDGVHYHFSTPSEFRAMLDAGELLEWAEVHGHMYGTPRRNLLRSERRGEQLVLDIDVQGALQVKTRVPEAVLVFVLPPSGDALVERLRGRGTEAREIVMRRLRNARGELERAEDFDHVVINEELDRAVREVRTVVAGHGSPLPQAIDLSAAIRQLQRQIDEILEAGLGSAPS